MLAGVFAGVAVSANPSLATDLAEVLPGSTAEVGPEEAGPEEAGPEYAVTPPADFADVKLANAGTLGSPAVTVNPKNSAVFLAAYANNGGCWVRTSSNAGRTWAAARRLPQVQNGPYCDTPTVIWAPDGSRVYAAYSYSYDPDFAQMAVTSSTDRGATWSPPKIAMRYANRLEAPHIRLATSLGAGNANWLYLLSTQYPVVNFTRSGDSGKTWYSTQRLITCGGRDEYVSDPSVAGGPKGEVLVAWGSNDCNGTSGARIEVRYSANFGATFSPALAAAPNVGGKTAVAFGSSGVAHLVYVPDYVSGAGPYYAFSTKAPYGNWSSPLLLNDAVSVNEVFSPALTVSSCGASNSVLHAIWLDDRAGAGKLNVYYTRKVTRTAETWAANLRVSATSPGSDSDYPPLLIPAIAPGVSSAVGLWGQETWSDTSGPVWASRIASGVSCP